MCFGLRAAKWLKIMHRYNSKTKRILVCEEHFESRYINNNESRKRLVATAVPTLHLPETEALDCTPDVNDADNDDADKDDADNDYADKDDADNDDADNDDADNSKDDDEDESEAINSKQTNKRPLGEKYLENRIKRVKASENDIVNFAERAKIKTENSQIIISEIIQLHSRFRELSAGEKYTDSFKLFALKLYFTSPKTYKVMQSVLNLPSISTLYRLLIPSKTQLCENLIIALKIKVDTMTDEQKQCAVCIGTMDLKAHLDYDLEKDQIIGFHDVDGALRLEPAQTALIVMVRGIFHNWKQAVAYSFLAQYQDYEDVRINIYEIINKMFDIGLNVRVFISDIESDFVGISKEKRISSTVNFILVNGKKVYYMYDPPHLIKVMRDHLMNYNIQFQGKTATSKHILQCYDHDCKQALRLAPKLTSYHIVHTHMQSEKDKVKLAAEVFSKTTATAISTYADLKVLDESAKETADWILKMDNLFDMLNFGSCHSDDRRKQMFRGEIHQIKFLREMICLFKNLRLLDTDTGTDVTRSTKFTLRFIVTLKAIIALSKDLKSERHLLPYIGLSRDCLDIFFDKVRLKYDRLPTCKQMALSIDKMPIFTVFNYNSKKNGMDTLDRFLMEAKNVDCIKPYELFNPDIKDISSSNNLTADINLNVVALSTENPLQYLCAYLLYKGYQHHSDCGAMKCYVFENNGNTTDTTVILTIKSTNNTNDNTIVVMVPTNFVEFIESMEIILKLYFETEHRRHPLKSLKERLLVENVAFSRPCKCFPLEFIKELYIRYRLHILVEYNNKEFETKKDCKNCFTVNQL